MKPTKNPPAQKLEQGRRNEWELDLYEADQATPLELGASDVLTCNLWSGEAGATPYATITKSANANGSIITVNNSGTAGSVPANITITVEPDDADLVTVGEQHMEVTVARAAASTKPYVVCRCKLISEGSPA